MMLQFHPKQFAGNVVGVDPGMSGAYALIGRDGEFIDRKCDFASDVDLAESLKIMMLGNIVELAVIEDVHARPLQGVVSMFKFGYATGIARSQLYTAGFHTYGQPLAEPVPGVWKRDFRTGFEKYPAVRRFLGTGDDFDSREVCKFIWGDEVLVALRRKKDHNTADALCLAYWGKFFSRIPAAGIDRTPRSIYAK